MKRVYRECNGLPSFFFFFFLFNECRLTVSLSSRMWS